MSAASALSGLRRRASLRMLKCCLNDGGPIRNHVCFRSAWLRAYGRATVGSTSGLPIRSSADVSRKEWIRRRFTSASAPQKLTSAPQRPASGTGSAASQVSAGGSAGPKQVQPRDPTLKPLAAALGVVTAAGGGFLWWTWEDGGREATERTLRPAFEFLGLQGPDLGGAKLGGEQRRMEQPKHVDVGQMEREQKEGETKDQEDEAAGDQGREDAESREKGREKEEGRDSEQQQRPILDDNVEEAAEVAQAGEEDETVSVDEQEGEDDDENGEEELSDMMGVEDKNERGTDLQADVTMSEMAAGIGARLTKAADDEEEEEKALLPRKQVNETAGAGTGDGDETSRQVGVEEGGVVLVEAEQNGQSGEEGEHRDEVVASVRSDAVRAGKKAEAAEGEEFRELGGLIYGMMMKQEEAIQAAFESRIQRVEEEHRQELNDERANALRHAQKASTLEKELTKQKLLHAKALKEQFQREEEKRQRELHQLMEDEKRKIAELKVALEAKSAATIANERAGRIEETDRIRMKLNALQLAFDGHAEESRRSLEAHKIAMGAFVLEDALMRGQPLSKLAKLLEASAKDDPLICAVVDSLSSPEIERMGAPTRLQLWNKFEASRPTLKELAFLPQGGGGVLAHAVAKLAARLKVKEQDSNLQGGGLEAVLARVESLFVEGRLLEAASMIQEGVSGTRAEEVVSDWVQLVRNRVVAEQAVSMLQAAATVMAAAST